MLLDTTKITCISHKMDIYCDCCMNMFGESKSNPHHGNGSELSLFLLIL